MSLPPHFGVVGWKGGGKTTLVTGLVDHLTGRGYRVGTIKHAHHGFDVDQPGTDSHSHRQAGAREVVVSSGRRFALMHELPSHKPEPSPSEVMARMDRHLDLVLIEGYKSETHAKIEATRAASYGRGLLAARDATIVAVASDRDLPDIDQPVFDLDDVGGLAQFIVEYLRLDVLR